MLVLTTRSRAALPGREESSAPARPLRLGPEVLGMEGTAGTELKAARPGTMRLPEDEAGTEMLGCPCVLLGMGMQTGLLLA